MARPGIGAMKSLDFRSRAFNLIIPRSLLRGNILSVLIPCSLLQGHSSGVPAQIPLDVLFRAGVRLKDPEMTLAEDIRFQSQQLFHGFSPLADVGGERRHEGAVDVLAEEDALIVTVQICDDRSGRMTGGMEAVEGFLAETEDLFLIPPPPDLCSTIRSVP